MVTAKLARLTVVDSDGWKRIPRLDAIEQNDRNVISPKLRQDRLKVKGGNKNQAVDPTGDEVVDLATRAFFVLTRRKKQHRATIGGAEMLERRNDFSEECILNIGHRNSNRVGLIGSQAGSVEVPAIAEFACRNSHPQCQIFSDTLTTVEDI